MRKEVLWATLAGIIFGLVIAFGIARINSTVKPKGISSGSSPTPSPNPQEFKITLDKPEENDVITEGSVTVAGITKALTWITISGEDGDYFIQADEKGSFEEDVTLTPGVNQIKVAAFDPLGEKSIQRVLVVYSSSFEKKEIKTEDVVAQRIDEALNKPKAYLGVVTDIADSTIQVKTGSGEIKQISTNKDAVTVVKTGTTNKVVKFADIAIGDFIVAMGYINGNQVLNAQRILITPAVVEPKTEVTLGTGADITPVKTTLVYSFKEGKLLKVKSTDIEDEDKIIYVTAEVNEKPTIRTVFVIIQS